MNLLLETAEGQRLALRAGADIMVGSDAACALRLPEAGMAQMARFQMQWGEAWLHVHASDPPVVVNGRPVQALARLFAGDRVCFGSTGINLLLAPEVDEDLITERPLASFALRLRSGAGSGGLIHGPVLHLDAAGEPVSAAAGTVGLVLTAGVLMLEPGRSQVRHNGWPVSEATRLLPEDQIQVGQRRYRVEAAVASVLLPPPVRPPPLPPAPPPTSAPEPTATASERPPQHGLWWLVGIAALIAAGVSALLYFRV